MGKCGKMWGDMGNVFSKISDQFCQSIFSEDNLAFLAYYFEVTTKSTCMRFSNCGCWEMWEMLEKVETCGDRLTSKPYEQVWKSIIVNRKLPFSANYFEVTIKSISTRSTNCRTWGIWVNVAKCGVIWGTFSQKLATNFVSQYSARIIYPFFPSILK